MNKIDQRAPHLRCLVPNSSRGEIHLPKSMNVTYLNRSILLVLVWIIPILILSSILSACASANPSSELERSYDQFMANPIDEFEGMEEHAMLKTVHMEESR